MSTRKRKGPSEVWDHFYKTDAGRAICRSCGADLNGDSKSGTSHLKRHIEFCKSRSNKNANLPQTLTSRNSGLTGDETLEDKVKVAIVGEIPLANLGSKKIVYNLMGCMDLEKEILAYYERERGKMADELKNLTSQVTLSFEIIKEDYISIIAHYIDGEFNLLRKVLGFKRLDDPAEYYSSLLDAIKSCIYDWKLENKIFSILVEECNIEDLEELKKLRIEFSPNTLLNGKYFFVNCFQDALQYSEFFEILSAFYKKEIDEIWNFVQAVKIVPDRMAIFNNIVDESGLSHIDTLIVKKWQCTDIFCSPEDIEPLLKMLKEVIVYKNVFSRYAEKAGQSSMTVNEDDSDQNRISEQIDYANFSCMDTNTETGQPLLVQNTETGQPPLAESDICSIDWNRVQNIVEISELVLKIFEDLSARIYPTSNLVFPKMIEIEHLIIKLSGETSDISYHLIRSNKFGQYNIANTLDPRYKQTFYKYVLKEILAPHKYWDSDEDKEPFEEVFCAYANKEIKEPSAACIESGNTQDPVSSSNSIHHTCGVVSMFSKEIEKKRKPELYRYLDDEFVGIEDSSFNLLAWWKQNESKYPVLSMIARDFLAVPANVFSMYDIIDASCEAFHKVSPQLLEAVICSKAWIQFDPPKHTRVEYLSEQGFMLEKSYHGNYKIEEAVHSSPSISG